MKPKDYTRCLLPLVILILNVLACGQSSERTGPEDTLGATQTLDALATHVAGSLTPDGDLGAPEGGAEQPDSTTTPEPSVTATPTITVTSTLSAPVVHVSVDTNCRFGPGEVYEYQGALMVGEEAEVTGKLADESFWYIENPDAPPPYCWIWGMYATVVGDKSGIPILTPPPTPTATPVPFAFETEFGGAIPCGAYAFFARIENTGSVAIESLYLEVTDTTINLTNTHVNDIFSTSVDCTPFTTPRLEPGEVGYTFTSGFQTIANHTFEASVTVCTQDGLVGECQTKTFSVP